MNTEMFSQQNYSFWRFAPFAGLVFHLLFVTHRPIQMKYPQKQLEVLFSSSSSSSFQITNQINSFIDAK